MNSTQEESQPKRHELLTFVFLTLILAPLLSVLLIGGYGLLIWLLE